MNAHNAPTGSSEVITLGGGCFWCLDAVYRQVRGVLSVQCGYSNGTVDAPSYDQVCTGRTGHAEVVRVTFDPDVIALDDVLEIFFVIHDPTTLNAQGHDVGTQYRSGIYWHTPEQREKALAMIDRLNAQKVYGRPIVTEVAPEQRYGPAEDEHQNYFQKHPHQGYCLAVAAPKVEKFRRAFAQWVRDTALSSLP
ncbi:MAG: peptide-methionine (S)-S-oxide reductase MsrA [Rhodoferax sp.]